MATGSCDAIAVSCAIQQRRISEVPTTRWSRYRYL